MVSVFTHVSHISYATYDKSILCFFLYVNPFRIKRNLQMQLEYLRIMDYCTSFYRVICASSLDSKNADDNRNL